MINAWVIQHLRALAITARQVALAPLAHLFHALVIGVAITLPLLLHVTVLNLDRLSRDAQADARIALYLAPGATARDVEVIAARLTAHPLVAGQQFISRDQALADLKRRHGIGDLIDALPGNPLPDAFIVRARTTRAADLESLRGEASKWPRVALAQLDSAWAARLEAGLSLARELTLGLAGLLAAALVAITFNTIGLQVASRREEIEVSRLIGATHGFIRRPFLYAGTLQGAAGGAFAGLLTMLCVRWVNSQLPALGALYSTDLAAQPLPVMDLMAVVGFSALLGWLGAWLAATRHLWRVDPD